MINILWIISSSVLILAVIAIRAVFGKRLSAGLRYGLWALVLVRLLIPGTLFSAPISVSGAAQQAEAVKELELLRGVEAITQTESGAIEAIRTVDTVPVVDPQAAVTDLSMPAAEKKVASTIVENATQERFVRMQRSLKLRDVFKYVWLIGSCICLSVFIISNLSFYFSLRSKRKRLPIDCRRPVYSVDKLASSCLFLGTVYISGRNAEDEASLRYVLEHELAHYRHGDHLTVFLRSAALALHWFNPLVWWAAMLSKQDSELFADAGAISRLGEDEREGYGLALIGLAAMRTINPPVLCAAITMANGKRRIKQRITHIAANRRMSLTAAAAVMLIASIAAGSAFAGGMNKAPLDREEKNAVISAPVESAMPSEAYAAHTVETDDSTASPTVFLTEAPSETPNNTPPGAVPGSSAAASTEAPSSAPSRAPSAAPSQTPMSAPTELPLPVTTSAPAPTPTAAPTAAPTAVPNPVSTPKPTYGQAGYFIELKDGVTAYADLDGDGTDDAVLIEEAIDPEDGHRFTRISIVWSHNPGVSFTYDTMQGHGLSAAIVDCDPNDGRKEVIVCNDMRSSDYITYVVRYQDNSQDYDVFAEGFCFGTEASFSNGFPADYTFSPSQGLPMTVCTNILGTYGVFGRFTVTNQGVKILTPQLGYPENAAPLTLLRELDVTLPDGSSLTVSPGTVIVPRFTDAATSATVELPDGALGTVGISFSGDRVLINGIDQDEYADMPYAD